MGNGWKRSLVAGAVVAGAVLGPVATASADSGTVIANDGCTFSSVGGSCSDPGPVGHALIALRAFAVSLGWGTGITSGTAYFI
ncbi:hypothetical protein [Nocardia camponoti]|uniref:Secreted protein n=1 Tax=Nocardia camponoti TaxID=1616106 RepID=A0A917QIS0_9NOCA|nr:hypothetical protein [Nocardia camponoti]GGK52466.1 hypothetical protein GCM10011591_25280 [Nocardia camponoti]